MIRKILIYMTFVPLVMLAACESGEPDAPTPEPPTPEKVSRTVLVYMVADNSLGSGRFDSADLAEMESAADKLGTARWVVYHDSYDSDKMPELRELTPDGWVTLRTYDHKEYSVQSSRMSKVIDDVKALAPADSYGLVLWSHAHGWLQNGMEETPAVTPRSFGDDRGHTMNITTLASVLDGCGFDYVYADCCYMASVEVAYELRYATRYFVASATELPSPGMPYDLNVEYLADGSRDALVRAASNTFGYYDALTGQSRTCTMSVIDTSGLDALAAATRDLYTTPGAAVADDYVPQRFMLDTRCYYYDFGDYVEAFGGVDAAVLSRWHDALGRCVIYSSNTPYIWDRVPLKAHCGLSTYILDTEEASATRNYNTLAWWNDVASHRFK